MHRDYTDPGGYVAIAVFDDRVEVRSYGRLPAGITLHQLSMTHLSRLRNPLIAEAFHRTGAVEIWGRGINRVISLCRDYGVAPPKFHEQQGFLVVTLPIPRSAQPDPSAEFKTKGTQKSSLKGSQKSSQKIIILISEQPEITIDKLANALGISERAIKKNIRILKDQGKLARIGPDKGGHWKILS